MQNLRTEGTINPNEIAYIMGDLLLVEDIKSGEKRALSHPIVAEVLGENRKRILKG
jgi:hypothetical protein